MSVEPCLQSIYATFCHSVITKINAEHIILLKNLRYQPHIYTRSRDSSLHELNTICPVKEQREFDLALSK